MCVCVLICMHSFELFISLPTCLEIDFEIVLLSTFSDHNKIYQLTIVTVTGAFDSQINKNLPAQLESFITSLTLKNI